MKPKKKSEGPPPDAAKDEPSDTLGGTNGEGMGDDEDWGRTVPDDVKDLEYGRPQEQGGEEDEITI